MGSFNVACSISSISIGPGTPVAFFLLLPASYKYEKERPNLVGTQSYLHYDNCYFNPLSLPVFGKYNDYGSIEDIIEDGNARALEAFFGLSISDIISCVTCGRDPGCNMSESFRIDALNKELFTYDVPFDAAWLKAFGFVENDGFFSLGAHPYKISIFETEHEFQHEDEIIKRKEPCYQIWDSDNNNVGEQLHGQSIKRNLISAFATLTGTYFHLKPEAQKRTRLLTKLSGMFVHRDIYYALASSRVSSSDKNYCVIDNGVTEVQLQELGFKQVSEEEQVCFDPHHQILFRKEGFPYDVKWGNYGLAIVHQKYKEYYVFGNIMDFSPEKVRNSWEKMTGTAPEDTFPEPKILRKPTDIERTAIINQFSELTGGGKLCWAPQTDETNHHVFSLRKFAGAWGKMTGDVLDISSYAEKSQHKAAFEELRQKLIAFSQIIPKVHIYKYPCIEKQREAHDREEDYRKIFDIDYVPQPFDPKPEDEEYEYVENIDWQDPLGYINFGSGTGDLGLNYRDWVFFSQIYRQPIMEGSEDLLQAFDDYHMFHDAMFRCNRFFFPAMNGEQCGNFRESRNLTIATLRVIESALADQEQYIIEDMVWDAEHN